jgi:hypothetical protein
MALVGGFGGRVDFTGSTYGAAKAWSFDRSAPLKHVPVFGDAYAESVGGGKKRGTGTVEVVLDDDPDAGETGDINDVAEVGDSITLTLYEVDGTRYYTIPAKIASIGESVQADGAEEITYTVGFETNGQWTHTRPA